jgi:hypothetical protein
MIFRGTEALLKLAREREAKRAQVIADANKPLVISDEDRAALRAQSALLNAALLKREEKNYRVVLTSPSRETTVYHITAANKTDARKKAAAIYREDTPSGKGYYSFGKMIVEIREVL